MTPVQRLDHLTQQVIGPAITSSKHYEEYWHVFSFIAQENCPFLFKALEV